MLTVSSLVVTFVCHSYNRLGSDDSIAAQKASEDYEHMTGTAARIANWKVAR
jgi:hypothetical protein